MPRLTRFNAVRTRGLGALALALVMAATRYQHFGDALHLPDASLAVFFLGGLLAAPAASFAALLVEAGLLDYLAITVGGVSDYCVTPAYGFLVPAYGALWLGGRWVAAQRSTPRLYSALFVSVSLAFVISNTGFYAFSGRVAGMDPADYGLQVARYYPPYALTAFGYVTVALLLHLALERARRALAWNRG